MPSFFIYCKGLLEMYKIRYLTHPNIFHLGNKVGFFLWGLYIILFYYTRLCSSYPVLPWRTETNNCTPQGQGVSRMHAKCCILLWLQPIFYILYTHLKENRYLKRNVTDRGSVIWKTSDKTWKLNLEWMLISKQTNFMPYNKTSLQILNFFKNVIPIQNCKM